MTEEQVYENLREIFSEVFLRDDIVLMATTTAADVNGWDSFKQIEIVMAVEERFGIKLHTRDIDNLKNVGTLVKIIEAKL